VRVWEVRDAAGRHRGLFFGDYFARPSKHSGAWMTRLRDREKLKGDIRPLVVNVMNFSKASDGEPTLLSFDDAKTIGLCEILKQLRLLLRRHADSAIRDRKLDPVASVSARRRRATYRHRLRGEALV
jgi:Peptidase family M3